MVELYSILLARERWNAKVVCSQNYLHVSFVCANENVHIGMYVPTHKLKVTVYLSVCT